MFGRFLTSIGLICSALFATPALAGRTAIDQNPDGTPLHAYVGGYCDINGDDCEGNKGLFLPYKFKVGTADLTDRVVVHGNGLLGLGGAFQFTDNYEVSNKISNYERVDITEYGLNLISAGPFNDLDFNSYAFLQSATVRLVGANRIKADWFICGAPTAPGVCPHSITASLTLTPTKAGFAGHFSFPADGTDRGYVIDGVYTGARQDFVLPAIFEGVTIGVPEPASWAMMISGFGIVGAAFRRRGKRLASLSS